jgi:ABC-2 type transport system ATP-binding protein
MKQRLALATALLNEPEVLFLDEPTKGLDPEGQQRTRALITEMASRGTTVFLCSHLLHEVEQVCSRVAVLKKGELIAEGEVAELLRRGRWIRLRLAEADGAAPILEALPWVGEVRVEDGGLLVEAPVERAAEINAALARESVFASEIRPAETTLESFFIDLVKGEQGGDAG